MLPGLQSTAAGSLGFRASGIGDSSKELATPPSLTAGVRHGESTTAGGAGECGVRTPVGSTMDAMEGDSSVGQTKDQGSGVQSATHAGESVAPPGGGGVRWTEHLTRAIHTLCTCWGTTPLCQGGRSGSHKLIIA